eukprot:jgi/Mesen1/1005/ME000120S00159
MPALGEILALPAPPPGGLKDATPSTLEPETVGEKDEEKQEKAKPAMVATHTKTIGMIHPPPDIRSIVDKTAEFVSRNGPDFEKRILAANKNNAKFNFLTPTDPYHAYYRHRVGEFRAQKAAPAGAPGAPGGGDGGDGVAAISALAQDKPGQEGKGEGAKPAAKTVSEPEKEQYTVHLPDGMTGLDLDVIKLTAQFVARNGKTFLTGLTSREHMNPQFAFLKPTHSMFTFFTTLADAYSKVLMPPKGLLEGLRRQAGDRTLALERSLDRLEWERSQQAARQRAEDEIEAERTAMAMIDWHDFVVVETIEFVDEEEEGLPQPETLEEVLRRRRQLAEDEELDDADRAAGPIRIVVAVPSVEGEEKLNGQSVDVTVESVGETTGQLKERIAAEIGLPANKQKLNARAGFFKDSLSLAYYNVAPGDVVTLNLKERGGRKK